MRSTSASRMSSSSCGLIMGNRLIMLGRVLVEELDGDGALVMGVDVLSGALNEPGVDGAFSM